MDDLEQGDMEEFVRRGGEVEGLRVEWWRDRGVERWRGGRVEGWRGGEVEDGGMNGWRNETCQLRMRKLLELYLCHLYVTSNCSLDLISKTFLFRESKEMCCKILKNFY